MGITLTSPCGGGWAVLLPTGSGLDPEIHAKSDEKCEQIVGVAG